MKQIWEADKLLLVFTLFKNSIEQVFYVFFFVYLTKYIFNCIENNIEYSRLFRFLVIACSGHICIHFICGWYETYRKIKTPEVYRHIFHRVIDLSDTLELKDYESPEFYDKYARALDNCVDQAMNIAIKTGVYIGNVISTVMSVALAIMVDPAFLVFLIVPMIVSLSFGKKNAKTNFEREKTVTRDKRTAEYVKRVYYEKKYAAEVRLYDVNDLMIQKQEEAVNRMEQISLGYRMKTAFYSFIMKGSYSIFAGIVAYFYVVFRVKYGNVADVSSYVAMITAMSFSTYQLKSAVENRIYIFNESKLFENLEEFLEQDRKPKGEKLVLDEIKTVEFKNVSFTYPGADTPTINGVSFKWSKGGKIAIVGYNGAGKTTFVKLLMRLYDITSGSIKYGGHDIREYATDEYRKKIGAVFQDYNIYAASLAENVLMRKVSEEDADTVVKALEKADFGKKLQKLPDGINTQLTKEFSEEGTNLSGGESQKVAISRIFAGSGDRTISILDEPSSALDPVSEYKLNKNLIENAKNDTIIFISHRLSTTRMADRIYLFEQGTIKEQGTHDELMALNGRYREMFDRQAQNYIV